MDDEIKVRLRLWAYIAPIDTATVDLSSMTDDEFEALLDTGDAFTAHADWYPDPVVVAETAGTEVEGGWPPVHSHKVIFGV